MKLGVSVSDKQGTGTHLRSDFKCRFVMEEKQDKSDGDKPDIFETINTVKKSGATDDESGNGR